MLGRYDWTAVNVLRSPTFGRSNIEMVIFVLSMPANYERRIQMRQDLSKLNHHYGHFRVVFLLGLVANNGSLEQMINEEYQQFDGKY